MLVLIAAVFVIVLVIDRLSHPAWLHRPLPGTKRIVPQSPALLTLLGRLENPTEFVHRSARNGALTRNNNRTRARKSNRNKTMHRSGRSVALDISNFFGVHSVMVAVGLLEALRYRISWT